jgi:hypothetical protein
MERVGLVVLSIVVATALVVGSSYWATWVQPLLPQIPALWMIVGAVSILSLGYLLSCRRHRRARA